MLGDTVTIPSSRSVFRKSWRVLLQQFASHRRSAPLNAL
jgi:hypothetical protein